MPFFFILSLRQVGHLISRVICISLFYQNSTCFFLAYFLIHHQILNILSHLVIEKYGDKTLNDFDLGLIDFNKIENEINLLNQDLNTFESSPSINQLQILGERVENLFYRANELVFLWKKLLLKNYPEINIS
jgi:hypothetical protein